MQYDRSSSSQHWGFLIIVSMVRLRSNSGSLQLETGREPFGPQPAGSLPRQRHASQQRLAVEGCRPISVEHEILERPAGARNGSPMQLEGNPDRDEIAQQDAN